MYHGTLALTGEGALTIGFSMYNTSKRGSNRSHAIFCQGRLDKHDGMTVLTKLDHPALKHDHEIRISEIKLAQLLCLRSVKPVSAKIDEAYRILLRYGPVIRLPQVEPLARSGSRIRNLAWLNHLQALLVLNNLWLEWGGVKRRPTRRAEAIQMTNDIFRSWDVTGEFIRAHFCNRST